MVRTAMERWYNGINNFADNTGVTNALTIKQTYL